MNKILLILTLYLLEDAVFSEIPCLTWEMTSDKLDIICRLDNVVLPVSIYDNFGNELGKCVFKDFAAFCSSMNKLADITASYSKGEFKLSFINVTRSRVKGEWSCIQETQTFKTTVSPSAEFKSNGSETIITKDPVIIPENETDVSPNTPVKETANITKTGLKWSFIAMAAVLPVLLIMVICYCMKKKKKESVFRNCIPETVELNQPLLIDNKAHKEHKQRVGKLVLLIAKISKKVIKRIVTCTLLTDDQTFTSYLNNVNNKHTLFHAWHFKKKCCQCKPDDNGQKESLLTKQQFHIMFNNNGSVPESHVRHVHELDNKIHCLYNIAVNENVSLDVLDVSVANCLLVCGYTPEKVTDKQSILDSMRIIKDKRNEISDMVDSNNLSDNEFNDKWQKIQSSVVDLASVVNSDFCNEIKEEIDDLQHEYVKDTTACSEKLAELVKQSKQDISLKLNQLYEEKFRSKLTEDSKITEINRNIDQLELKICLT